MRTGTNSLERALAILEMLERTPGGLRHGEISRQLQMPKSTCTYITERLAERGYVVRDGHSGRYKIGLTTVALAHGALREIGVRSIAEPALYKLASDTGLSAGIGVLERGRVLIIDRVEGSEFVRDAVETAEGMALAAEMRRRKYRERQDRDIGRELPAHTTALGKVLLAHLPREEAAELLARQELARQTKRSITSRAKLMRELDLVRKQGYAISDEEQSPGIRAIAAPIFGPAGTASAGVALNGSVAEAAWRDADLLVERVKAAGREISRRARLQQTVRVQ
ncbi:MAG TPA: IclR family transcriptional regulator [Bryobacteraceae bacterium]|nr:IclR family transcriptional regulator [Bryobacteraceae bacterium]